MTKRKVVAMATVAALPLFVGSTSSAAVPPPAPAPAAHTMELSESPAPQWTWVWGMEGGDALAFGVGGAIVCAPFIWIGSVGCGIVGAF